MTVLFQSGYSLPGGDQPLTHARILHARNWVRPHTFSGGHNEADYPRSAIENTLTYERWRPKNNELPDIFDLSDYVLTGGSDAGDGKTFVEDTGNRNHKIVMTHTFASATSVVWGVRVNRKNVPEIRLLASDGTNTFGRWFDLGALTYGSEKGTGTTAAKIIDLGNDIIQINLIFTPAAAAGNLTIHLGNGGSNITYTGTEARIRFERVTLSEALGTLNMYSHTAAPGDCLCIAQHNIGSVGGSVRLAHDSNEDDTWTSVETFAIDDDSPIMILFNELTTRRWRVRFVDCAVAEVAVLKIGKALQIPRAIYGGHNPLDLQRQTVFRTNLSEEGEVLGRTTQRRSLEAPFDWPHVEASWVRSNWGQLQRAAEEDAMFIAWRPDDFGEVGFGEVTQPPSATNMGIADLMQVGLNLRGVAYD